MKTADVIAQKISSHECRNKDEKVHFPSIPVFLTIDRMQPNLTSVVANVFGVPAVFNQKNPSNGISHTTREGNPSRRAPLITLQPQQNSHL